MSRRARCGVAFLADRTFRREPTPEHVLDAVGRVEDLNVPGDGLCHDVTDRVSCVSSTAGASGNEATSCPLGSRMALTTLAMSLVWTAELPEGFQFDQRLSGSRARATMTRPRRPRGRWPGARRRGGSGHCEARRPRRRRADQQRLLGWGRVTLSPATPLLRQVRRDFELSVIESPTSSSQLLAGDHDLSDARPLPCCTRSERARSCRPGRASARPRRFERSPITPAIGS
jgi:hypothetical protein